MLKNIRASKSVYMLAYVLELVFYCIRGHYIYVETGFFGLSGNTITYVFHVAGSLLIMLCWSPRFKPLILLSSGLFAAGFIPALFLPEGVLRLIFACAGMFGLGGAVSACRCGYAFVSNNSERLTGMSLMIILVALIHRTDWAGTENAFTNQVLPIIVISLLIFCLLRFKEEDFDVREETGPEDKKGLYWAFAFFTAYFAIDGFIYDLANTSIETKPTFMFAGLIIAGIMLFIMLGKLMVSVRLGIQPALDIQQDGYKGGGILPCEEHCICHLDVGKAAVGVDDVTAPTGNGDELRIVLRCGEHILLLDMQTEISGTAAVVGKIGHANTTPFRWANWFAVSMTSLVS